MQRTLPTYMGRSVLRGLALWLSAWAALFVTADGNLSAATVRELHPSNVTSNLANWHTDQLIMFYAPWCKYCKQLRPSWESMALLSQSNTDLSIGTLNCEGGAEHKSLCISFGVDRYPSVYFVGYGKFHQSRFKSGLSAAAAAAPQLVHFSAALYPEAIYDWMRMLVFLSTWQRRWANFKSIFTGKSTDAVRVERMAERLQAAERKAELFSKQLEKYKANELFDELEDQGDVFPILNKLVPDENNLPLRVCVADMAGEYCK